MKKLLTIGFIMLGVLGCNSVAEESKEPNKDLKIIGYIAGWKGVEPDKIAAEKLTHINYAFANVIAGLVTEGEGRAEMDKANIEKLHSLKSRNPDLKILISVGGWTWSGGFSDAVLTEASRKKFTASAIDYLKRHKLDGLDFDWEYPGLKGDDNIFRPEDRENFVAMLRDVRQALDSLGKVDDRHYLHTIATGGFQEYLDVNDMAEAQKYLDFINIMTYDFVGPSSDTTGHHTNLYASTADERSAAKAVAQHVAAGIPIEKLVLGIAFYGKSWTEVPSDNNGLYQPGKGSKGYSYKAIEELLDSEEYARHYHSTAQAPYIYHTKSGLFITYEDTVSIKKKGEFIKEKGLGGGMFWEYNEDNQDNDLLNALYKALKVN